MGLRCSGKCGMIFLIVLNLLFFLLGLGILIVGIIMKVDTSVFDDDEVIAALNDVSLGGNLKLGDLAKGLSTFLIVLGVFIFILAALGLFGACCKNKILLIVYAVLVILIIICQVVAVVLWVTMKDQVDTEVKSRLTTAMNEYQGYSTTHKKSVGWNYIFIGFDCCGVKAVDAATNPSEFAGCPWWSSRGSKKIPPSCCKNANRNNYSTFTDTVCTDDISSGHRTKGCYDKLNEIIDKYQYWAIVIGAVIIVIEVIAVIAAFVICYQVGKNEDKIV